MDAATKGTILLLEDEGVFRKHLARYLRSCGYRVVEFETLAGAREYVGSEPIDAALLDIFLPDGNGLDLLSKLDPQRTIVITSRPDAVTVHPEVALTLAKPIDLERVRDALAGLSSIYPKEMLA